MANLTKINEPFMRMRSMTLKFALLFILFNLVACKDKSVAQQDDLPEKPAAAPRSEKPKLLESSKALWAMAEKDINQAVLHADALEKAINTLLERRQPQNIVDANQIWRELMHSFERNAIFLYLARVAPEKFGVLRSYQTSLAAWPIEPGYLDAFGPYPYSGLVFDVDIPINEVTLRGQNGMTDASEASVGLYALEFILNGENHDRSAIAFKPITQISEKHKEAGYTRINELPRNRRRELLKLQAKLLNKDMQHLAEDWHSTKSESLFSRIASLPRAQQLLIFTQAAAHCIVDQMMVLSELKQQSTALDKSKPSTILANNQLQADRLMHQLQGIHAALSILSKELPVAENLEKLEAVSIELQAILKTPPANAMGEPPNIEWQTAFTTLKSIAQTLFDLKLN